MKKVISTLVLISILLLTFALSSCTQAPDYIPTPEEVIAAYEDAGYTVTSGQSSSDETMFWVVAVIDEPYDKIEFHFCESNEAALEESKTRSDNLLFYFVGFFFGDKEWDNCRVYGNVVCEYKSDEIITPFLNLMKGK